MSENTLNLCQKYELVRPFCEQNPGSYARYDIASPYIQDGFLVATDGRFLVRIPAAGEPEDSSRGKLPESAKLMLLPDGVSESDWQPWPKVDHCVTCKGTRLVRCDWCNGSGFTGYRTKEYSCDECANGKVDCPDCCKIGSFDFRFGETLLALWMAYQISRLPEVEFLPGKTNGSVRFRFAGGEGIAMGLNEDRAA